MDDEMTVVLSKEKFKALKGRDIEELIRDNLAKTEESLKADREEHLRKKLKRLEEKFSEMEGQLNELREFYEKAKKDKEKFMAVRGELREENERLRKELEEKEESSQNVNKLFMERERKVHKS
ncbi:hypothetical protein [Thermococcus sp. Bubb.Bath]|uniref:hypothetical protein n=1 Tax=Thermococcus sp. Bubb.Bath TaxID=1638242 RepID=UPI001439901D|nr:hypothetical protein [Thermococcus sp. Bubb.Bath]NJF24983.1 hypothetical protein [Thermococcus sp. Bubb.Bath]